MESRGAVVSLMLMLVGAAWSMMDIERRQDHSTDRVGRPNTAAPATTLIERAATQVPPETLHSGVEFSGDSLSTTIPIALTVDQAALETLHHLETLHYTEVEFFARRPGFGMERRPVLPWVEPATTPPKTPPSTNHLVAHKLIEKNLLNRRGSLHLNRRPGKQNSLQHGSILPEWELRRVELMGLLLNDEPVVYESETAPKMGEIDRVKTRTLDTFESKALEELLKGGGSIVTDVRSDAIRMVGAIRASKTCMECHDVPEHEMLGAFTYLLQRGHPGGVE
jgi:hypothetical protein